MAYTWNRAFGMKKTPDWVDPQLQAQQQQQQMQDLEIQRLQLENQKKQFDQQQAQNAVLAQQGFNPDGSPIAPQFNSMLDAAGNMQDKYKLAESDAMKKYGTTAMRDAGTNSEWANLMLQKQAVDQAQNMDNAASGANNSMMSAMSRLAQTGGVSGGARERALGKASQAGLMAQMQAARQGQTDKYNILTQDETNRMNQLQSYAGMQNDMNKYNTQNLLLETDAQRKYQQSVWEKKMEQWGANKTAEAQAKASGGGGKK